MAIGRISGPMLFSNLERQGVDLAFQSNLLYIDVNNLRVGVINSAPNYSFDASGNVKLSNIIVTQSSIRSNTGVIDFGSTSNISISGGAANQVLYTDGNGNLSWGEVSLLDSQWGNILLTDNTISIENINGNLYLQANGTGNVVTSNDFYAGNVYAANLTGNIQSNGGAFTGNISAPWIIGNVSATTINVVTENVTNGNAATYYITNLNSTEGNITTLVVTNFSTGNAVINGGYISSLSNITVTTGNTQSWYSTELNSTNANITTAVIDNFSTANAIVNGGSFENINLQANNFSTGNALVFGGVINNVNLQANNFSTANSLISGGSIYNVDLQTNNFSTANVLIAGGIIYNVDLQANNFSTGNAVINGGYISSLSNITVTTGNTESWYSTELNSTSANIITGVIDNFSTPNAQVTGGNITANLFGNISGTFGQFTGNLNADWFVGNIEGVIGNFNDVNVNSNLTVNGDLTASGNIIAQKITSPTGDLHLSAATNDPNNIIRFDSVSALDIASGTTAQRPPSPDSGYLRYNTDTQSIEWWGGLEWVSASQSISTQTITPDGLTAVYTLDRTTTEAGIIVNINGTVQQPSTAYTVSGNQITFASIPLVDDIIEIRFIATGIVAAPYYGGVINGNVFISNSTVSTSTTTGALVVTGGVGIGGNISIGGNIEIASTTGTPLNTTNPTSWLKVYISGIEYYMPLYQ